MGYSVEIGRHRERVEVVVAPRPAPNARTGRIKHANGENADIDYEMLEWLVNRALRVDQEQPATPEPKVRFAF